VTQAGEIGAKGRTAEIIGSGKVHVYDRRKRVIGGQPDYEALVAGTRFDLVKREPIASE